MWGAKPPSDPERSVPRTEGKSVGGKASSAPYGVRTILVFRGQVVLKAVFYVRVPDMVDRFLLVKVPVNK